MPMRYLLLVPVLLLTACSAEAEQSASAERTSPAASIDNTEPTLEATTEATATHEPAPGVTLDDVGSRITLDEAHAEAQDIGWETGPEEFDSTARELCAAMTEYGAVEWLTLLSTTMSAEEAPVVGVMAEYACPSLADDVAASSE